MESEQLRDESGPSGVKRDARRDGTSAEDGKHVPDPVGVFRVFLEDVQEPWIGSSVKNASAGVMFQHPVVPEDVDSAGGRRRRF